MRRVPTWGCGGELGARTEYTATAFSKPLMMIFSAIYRPTREVETLAKVSPYFPQEVRYRVEIEPTFERFVYGPLTGAVLRVADGMKVLQAGSLHAYLAYVIALVVSLVLLVWWTQMSPLSVSALLPAALIVHALATVAARSPCLGVRRWCRLLAFGGSVVGVGLTMAAVA